MTLAQYVARSSRAYEPVWSVRVSVLVEGAVKWLKICCTADQIIAEAQRQYPGAKILTVGEER